MDLFIFGPGAMAQQLKFSACKHWDPIWTPVPILVALLPIQLPACDLGKQSRTAQSLGTLLPRVEGLEELQAPGLG